MNDSGPHLNEKVPKNRMIKKNLKKPKVITYTNKVYFLFWWLNHMNFKVECILLEHIYIRCDLLRIFLENMSDNRVGCKGMSGSLGAESRFRILGIDPHNSMSNKQI